MKIKRGRSKRLSKNIPWPASEAKYEGYNNTKRPVHRGGKRRPAPNKVVI